MIKPPCSSAFVPLSFLQCTGFLKITCNPKRCQAQPKNHRDHSPRSVVITFLDPASIHRLCHYDGSRPLLLYLFGLRNAPIYADTSIPIKKKQVPNIHIDIRTLNTYTPNSKCKSPLLYHLDILDVRDASIQWVVHDPVCRCHHVGLVVFCPLRPISSAAISLRTSNIAGGYLWA